LSLGFSKKLENLKAAMALHVAHYNFCRRHGTLRITPAMAAGVEREMWERGVKGVHETTGIELVVSFRFTTPVVLVSQHGIQIMPHQRKYFSAKFCGYGSRTITFDTKILFSK